MESDNTTKEASGKKSPHSNIVHRILVHSYTIYFVLLLIGVYLDFTFPLEIFSNSIAVPAGVGLLVLATFLILWAQKSSLDMKAEHVTKETFCKGPYCYTRHPTHWGLFFLMLGFGIIANAVFVILFTFIAFLVTRSVFLPQQETALEHKYGAPYLEYKQSVEL